MWHEDIVRLELTGFVCIGIVHRDLKPANILLTTRYVLGKEDDDATHQVSYCKYIQVHSYQSVCTYVDNMYMCMYIHKYIYIYIYLRIYIYIDIHIYIYIYVCIYISIYMCTYVYICIHIYLYIYLYLYLYLCLYLFIYKWMCLALGLEAHREGWGETGWKHVSKLECCSSSRHVLSFGWSMSGVALCALLFSVSHCARILITS